MKKLILLFAIFATTLISAQKLEWRIDKDYKNAWALRGQTDLTCNAVQVALFDANNKFISKFTMRNDFGTFEYHADPERFYGATYAKIKCY